MTRRRDCADVVRLLPAMLEDAIEMRTRRWLSRHLGACPECAREERALRRTRELIGALPPMKLNPRTRARLVDRFLAEHGQGHSPSPSINDPPGSSAPSNDSTQSGRRHQAPKDSPDTIDRTPLPRRKHDP
jgi:hypothetical protein